MAVNLRFGEKVFWFRGHFESVGLDEVGWAEDAVEGVYDSQVGAEVRQRVGGAGGWVDSSVGRPGEGVQGRFPFSGGSLGRVQLEIRPVLFVRSSTSR